MRYCECDCGQLLTCRRGFKKPEKNNWCMLLCICIVLCTCAMCWPGRAGHRHQNVSYTWLNMLIFFSIFCTALASKYQMFALREFESFLLPHCGLGLTGDDGPSPVSALFPTNGCLPSFPHPPYPSHQCNKKLEQHRGLHRVRISLEDKIGEAAAKWPRCRGHSLAFGVEVNLSHPGRVELWPSSTPRADHTGAFNKRWCPVGFPPTDLVTPSLFYFLNLTNANDTFLPDNFPETSKISNTRRRVPLHASNEVECSPQNLLLRFICSYFSCHKTLCFCCKRLIQSAHW